MSTVTIESILKAQCDIRQRFVKGLWVVDVEDLKQPAGLAPSAAADAVQMRVIIYRPASDIKAGD